MWDDRGDGSSRPRGVVLTLDILGQGKFSQVLPMASAESIPVNYKALGYDLDENERPTFKYKIYDSEINDKIRIVDNKYLERIIKVKNSKNNLSFNYQIAEAKSIEKQSENTYLVDGTYMLKVDGASLNTINGLTILSKPIGTELVYSIIW